MNEVKCLYCGENFKIKSTPRMKQYLTCPFCKSVLQITSVSPLSVHAVEDEWENESEPRSYRQNRKNSGQQVRQESDEFDDQMDDEFSKSRDTEKRNSEKNKRNRKKLGLEMDE